MKTSRLVIIFSKGSLPPSPCKIIVSPLQERITDAIIKAVGNPYHARCFKCVGCEKNLDGVPFSMDVECSIYCVQCFQLRFSPRCCVCHDLIMPTFEQKVRTVIFIGVSQYLPLGRSENFKTFSFILVGRENLGEKIGKFQFCIIKDGDQNRMLFLL